MPAEHRLHDRVVAGVGERGPVEVGVVRQPAERFHPDGLARGVLAVDLEVDGRRQVAHVEGALVRPVLGDGVVDVGQGVRGRRQRLGVGDVRRKLDVVFEALVFVLEGGDHREDRHAVLVALGAAGRERPAVMDALHRERDRVLDVAGPQEVAVHRVHVPLVGHGAHRRDEGLREHLSAEHAPVRHPLGRSGEDVLAGAGPGIAQVQGGQEAFHRRVHGLSSVLCRNPA